MTANDSSRSVVLIEQECDFFSRLPIVDNYVEEEIHTLAPIVASSQNYIFDVLPSETRFTANKFVLITKWQLLTDDGEHIAESTHVAPADLIHHTMWSKVSAR